MGNSVGIKMKRANQFRSQKYFCTIKKTASLQVDIFVLNKIKDIV